MGKYLNSTGVTLLWNKIKNKLDVKADKEDVKALKEKIGNIKVVDFPVTLSAGFNSYDAVAKWGLWDEITEDNFNNYIISFPIQFQGATQSKMYGSVMYIEGSSAERLIQVSAYIANAFFEISITRLGDVIASQDKVLIGNVDHSQIANRAIKLINLDSDCVTKLYPSAYVIDVSKYNKVTSNGSSGYEIGTSEIAKDLNSGISEFGSSFAKNVLNNRSLILRGVDPYNDFVVSFDDGSLDTFEFSSFEYNGMVYKPIYYLGGHVLELNVVEKNNSNTITYQENTPGKYPFATLDLGLKNGIIKVIEWMNGETFGAITTIEFHKLSTYTYNFKIESCGSSNITDISAYIVDSKTAVLGFIPMTDNIGGAGATVNAKIICDIPEVLNVNTTNVLNLTKKSLYTNNSSTEKDRQSAVKNIDFSK